MTAMAPSWLTPSEDRTKWLVDDRKAATVRQIFDLAVKGHGTLGIARTLNEERVPTMTRAARWTFGVVNAILRNDAVIGVYRPKKTVDEPIPGYFPPIVADATFYLAQRGLKQRRWVRGREASQGPLTLFTGYSYCYACGAKMRP